MVESHAALLTRAAGDERLSCRARGVLATMLLHPQAGSADAITAVSREGRDAIRAALRELERAGYLSRRRERDLFGRLRTVVEVTPWAS